MTFLSDAQAQAMPVSRGVTVPLTAVQAGQGHTGNVFVIGDDDTIKVRPVTLGLKTAQIVKVLSGISPGERLALGDFAELHDGVKVAIQQ